MVRMRNLLCIASESAAINISGFAHCPMVLYAFLTYQKHIAELAFKNLMELRSDKKIIELFTQCFLLGIWFVKQFSSKCEHYMKYICILISRPKTRRAAFRSCFLVVIRERFGRCIAAFLPRARDCLFYCARARP